MRVLFVSGIDTEIGKTYVTGMLARALQNQGIKVITQKLIQTGVPQDAISDDIIIHRELMGMPLQLCDLNHTTCPYRYIKPASPHLAAALSGQAPDLKVVTDATRDLLSEFDMVLLEGAGGLLVPVTNELLSLDYIAEQGYPIVLVTTGRLGSINHTLLSLEAIRQRGLTVHSVIYNHIHDDDKQIANSSIHYMRNYIRKHYPETYWLGMAIRPPVPNSLQSADAMLPDLPADFVATLTADWEDK